MSTTNLPALAPIPGQLVLIELAETGDPGDDRVDRALAGYLAGYSGATLVGYRLDLRQWVNWITNLNIEVLGVARHAE